MAAAEIERGRIEGIDALRGLAAIAVMLHHHSWYYDQWFHGRGALPFSFSAGHFGVELFFIISGFVIFMTMERCATVYDFVASRAARLLPAFWAAMVLASLLLALHPMPPLVPPHAKVFLANMTMAPALFNQAPIDWSYWTLTYELVFYGFIALIFFAGLGKRVELVFLPWLALDAVLIAFRVPVFYRLNMILLLHYVNFFAIGICLYRIRSGKATSLTYLLLAGGIAAAALGGGEQAFSAPGPLYLGLTIAFTVAVWIAARGKVPLLTAAPLLFLGRISYSVYLVHQVMGYESIRLVQVKGGPAWMGLLLAFGATLAVATGMNFLIEVPGKRAVRALFAAHRKRFVRQVAVA